MFAEKKDRRNNGGKSSGRTWLPLLCLLTFSLIAVGCSTGRTLPAGDAPAATVPASTQPTLAEMEQVLQAELARLGKSTMAVDDYSPLSGEENAPFDLNALLIDPDGDGGAAPLGVQLTWTERMVGDYNQDGLVSAADLTPLGQYYGQAVEYLDPEDAGGIEYWPNGAVLNRPTDGESNWKMARIDGNGDGLINMQDITPIGQHWQERLAGYRFYIQHAGSTAWEPVMDPRDDSIVLEIPFGWFQPDLSDISYYDYYVNQYRLNLPIEIDSGDLIQMVPVDSGGTSGTAVEIAIERSSRGYLPVLGYHFHNNWPGYYYLYGEEVLGVWTEFNEYIEGDLDASGVVDQWDMVPFQNHGFVELATYEGPDIELVRHADQNGDGVLSVADLTSVGQNYWSRLDGYAFSAGGMVMNPDDPEIPFVVPRPFEFNIQNIPDWYQVMIPVTTIVDEIFISSVVCDSEPAYGDLGTIYISGYIIRSAPLETTDTVVAVITTGYLEVTTGTEMSLTGGLSGSNAGEITTYEWDLDGDGTFEATGSEQTVTPDTAGEYTFTLRVTDDQANTAEVELTVTVE